MIFLGLKFSLLGGNRSEFSDEPESFQEPPPVSGLISIDELVIDYYD